MLLNGKFLLVLHTWRVSEAHGLFCSSLDVFLSSTFFTFAYKLHNLCNDFFSLLNWQEMYGMYVCVCVVLLYLCNLGDVGHV